jgi:hypothetical protein
MFDHSNIAFPIYGVLKKEGKMAGSSEDKKLRRQVKRK